MTSNSLDIITRITVETYKNSSPKQKLGSGVIYVNKQLIGLVYILTAKHCLKGITNTDELSFRVFNPETHSYEFVTPSNQTVLCHPTDDAAIIVFNQRELAYVNSSIPSIYAVDHIVDFDEAVTKGFPVATLNQKSEIGESSLATINMHYLQEISDENAFQLSTNDDYNSDSIIGMSGSGIFIEACGELYINGIFTRFTDEDKGKVIISQRLTSFNELLGSEFKKKMPRAFLGHHGLGHKTFENNIKQSIANLGPRYCQRVNVKTGTVKYFDCVAKTPVYFNRLNRTIDIWLTERSYRIRKESSRIGHIESKLREIRSDFAESLLKLDRSVEAVIDLSELRNRVECFQSEVDETRYKLYAEFPSANKQDKTSSDIEADESRLLEIIRDLNSFVDDFDDLKIGLSNKPYLIVTGEAGCGKSHLMGDIAESRISGGLPTLLFLGTDFNAGTYEEAILSKIGFIGTFDEFLSSFNQIGIQVGSRSLLMIDALNEGQNAVLWKTNLSGLIKSLEKYPAIGLAVSVRDTYYDDVIPDDIQETYSATRIEHCGFKGLEYEAVKQFCFAYTLNLPNVPILTPEFCNPLFLKIICDSLEASGEKDFPKGFNGASAVFNHYFEVLDEKFAHKKSEYKYRKVVSKAVNLLAVPIFEAEYNLLKMQDADSILQKKFKTCPSLLADLIDNNVLLKAKSPYSSDKEDYVVFTYQRIGDYIIAKELVRKYMDWNSFSGSIETDQYLRWLFIAPLWSQRGVIEALAVLIPETFGHEITDIIPCVPTKHRKQFVFSSLDTLSEAFINSLSWRSIESINETQIKKFLKSKFCKVRIDDWFYKLVELSTISKHPFNADYFHTSMMRLSMRERDGELQFLFNGCAGYDDNDCANPLRRLIDWAWSEDISRKADPESSRLAAIMLCWLLSSTHIKYRDETTKALVNLLSEKVDILIDVMRLFEKVDDMYVKERIYSVAYGVALRTSSNEGLSKLSVYVYDTIFKHNNPPKDILLRDHARNIIEFADYKIGTSSINMKKIRPPYKSVLPVWPTDNEIEHLHIDYDAPDFDEKNGRSQNMIWESVKGCLADFWNKLALPEIERFYPISIEEEKAYNKAERLFKGDVKKCVRIYVDLKAREIIDQNRNQKKISGLAFDLALLFGLIEKMLTEEQLRAINKVMIPFKIKQIPLSKHCYYRFPAEGVRNWLVKRVYELGYDADLHGHYDQFAKNWTFGHSENRIDRIGKKYQWIAFHEIMGILADNFKYEDSYANDGRGGYEIFHGPWQSFMRNINPSMIVRENSIDDCQYEDKTDIEPSEWYNEESFDNWNYSCSDESWTSMIKDLPDPKTMIQKIDDEGVEWLTLNNFKSWDEPKEIGKEKYEHKLKKHYVSLFVYALLVENKNLGKAVRDLDGRDLWGWVELPDDDWQYLVNREKFWSPAYKDVYRNSEDWDKTINGLNEPYICAYEQACGHIEGDTSGTISSYSIPCRKIFEGLGMEYDSQDGRYIDRGGRLIAFTNGRSRIFVRKEPLIDFLEKNGLAVLWIVRGEKRVFISGGMGCLSEHNPCGVYFLDLNKNPQGVLRSYKRV